MAYKRTTFSTNDLFIERFWVFGHRFGEVPALCGAEPECERKAGISVKGLASRERLSASDVEEAAFKETDERQMIAAEGRDVRTAPTVPRLLHIQLSGCPSLHTGRLHFGKPSRIRARRRPPLISAILSF